jgi:hypothetical protein
MRGRATVTGCAVLIALAGCGGGERQDANEPEGDFKVEIVDASFPAKQSIADAVTMKISVHNADTEPLPNVAVTVATDPGNTGGAPQAFAQDIADPDVADASRPIWIVDQGPKGGDTAYTNTWSLGELPPGQTRDFEWKVTAVKAGDYTINYSVSPGLTGKAKPASGRTTKGTFKVSISDTPPAARVAPNGQVIREPAGSSSQN